MANMGESGEELNSEDEFVVKEFRDANLFLIDLSPDIFRRDPKIERTYFELCIESYAQILTEKLSRNAKDLMGLVFFGTQQWDLDPEQKHILTVQKLEVIETSMLIDAGQIFGKVEHYEQICSQGENPLNQVLCLAARAFDEIKIPIAKQQIILATARDQPVNLDEAERHDIRAQALNLRNRNIKLRVIGFGDQWNFESFWKDVQLTANNTCAEDAKQTKLEDLEVEIKFPSRPSQHLNFEVADGMQIRTVILSFTGTKYLKEVRLATETNEVLDRFLKYNTGQTPDSGSEEEEDVPVTTGYGSEARRGINYGGEFIVFTQEELQRMHMPRPPKIRLVGFKKTGLDLRFHIKPAKLLALDYTASQEEEMLFVQLIEECLEKKVMGICAVYGKGGPYLAKLLPCPKYGGFYLYRLAFHGQVNNLHDYVKDYIDGGQDNEDMTIDEPGVALSKKIIKKLKLPWRPGHFKNPKYQSQLHYLRTLAVDETHEPMEDSTLPCLEVFNERLGDLTAQFKVMFPFQEKRKRPKPRAENPVTKDSRYSEEMIQNLIETKQLQRMTIPVLKTVARSVGSSTTGTKADILQGILASRPAYS